MRHTIKLDVMHSIQVEPSLQTQNLRVSLCTGFVPVISKPLTVEQAGALIAALQLSLEELQAVPS